jgi:hypothetical protein
MKFVNNWRKMLTGAMSQCRALPITDVPRAESCIALKSTLHVHELCSKPVCPNTAVPFLNAPVSA